MWSRSVSLMFAALISVAAMLGAAVSMLLPSPSLSPLDQSQLPAGWRQVEWPFLKDQFGPGVALECLGAGCSTLLKVTVRPKIGFCNCTTGVADDEELTRIGDVGLLSSLYEPDGVGEEVTIGRLRGRWRQYAANSQPDIISAAYSSGCDAIVATARGYDIRSRQAVRAILESTAVSRWVTARLSI